MEQGFLKGSSDNLPKVDINMIDDFYMNNLEFLSAEIRNVKTARSTRESYGDSAVGYVQLKRTGPLCTIKAKIVPEHKVHATSYNVEADINEAEEQVIRCICTSCSASSGGCKHGVAFLFWLHRRSEEPSVTSVESYWKAPTLSQAGRSLKYMDLQQLTQRTAPLIRQKSDVFLKQVLEDVKGTEGGLFDVFRPVRNDNTSVWQLFLKYKDQVDVSLRNAEDFVVFMKAKMKTTECERVEVTTREQAKSSEWFDLRFARITASKIYEASRCKTSEGALTEAILGASAFKGTEATKRGQKLEPKVVAEVAKVKNIQIFPSGLLLNPELPVFGASPDGICNEYVIEVKCPSKSETVMQYVDNGKLKPKYYGQIQTQMFFANKQKGLFCVASPEFETNSLVSIYEVVFDKDMCEILFNAGQEFWNNAIFPVLNK